MKTAFGIASWAGRLVLIFGMFLFALDACRRLPWWEAMLATAFAVDWCLELVQRKLAAELARARRSA